MEGDIYNTGNDFVQTEKMSCGQTRKTTNHVLFVAVRFCGLKRDSILPFFLYKA